VCGALYLRCNQTMKALRFCTRLGAILLKNPLHNRVFFVIFNNFCFYLCLTFVHSGFCCSFIDTPHKIVTLMLCLFLILNVVIFSFTGGSLEDIHSLHRKPCFSNIPPSPFFRLTSNYRGSKSILSQGP
jgi:hypothetical protein